MNTEQKDAERIARYEKLYGRKKQVALAIKEAIRLALTGNANHKDSVY
jgi:hypothetical protein